MRIIVKDFADDQDALQTLHCALSFKAKYKGRKPGDFVLWVIRDRTYYASWTKAGNISAGRSLIDRGREKAPGALP